MWSRRSPASTGRIRRRMRDAMSVSAADSPGVVRGRSLTVVIVAHDAGETLDQTIERVVRALAIAIEDYRVVVFDDGSRDGT